jgi:hypothetical protein
VLGFVSHDVKTVKHKTLFSLLMLVLLIVVAGFFWCMGRKNVTLTGTAQWSFEESAFFPNSDCSVTPYWWDFVNMPKDFEEDMNKRWVNLGKPAAVRIKLRADMSGIGTYGHLGLYRRELRPISLISIEPAERCLWKWPPR